MLFNSVYFEMQVYLKADKMTIINCLNNNFVSNRNVFQSDKYV